MDEATRFRTWDMYYELNKLRKTANPNPSHQLFKWLLDHQKLCAVVTQNIDELHQQAGVPSSKVIELHGSSKRVFCLSCKEVYHNVDEILDSYKSTVELAKQTPRCSKCQTGILKFDTISFGEPLQPQVVQEATMCLSQADMLIVMGTSLVVEPASNMVTICLEKSVPVVLINIGSTFIDDVVNVLLKEKCGEACAKILKQLGDTKCASE